MKFIPLNAQNVQEEITNTQVIKNKDGSFNIVESRQITYDIISTKNPDAIIATAEAQKSELLAVAVEALEHGKGK